MKVRDETKQGTVERPARQTQTCLPTSKLACFLSFSVCLTITRLWMWDQLLVKSAFSLWHTHIHTQIHKSFDHWVNPPPNHIINHNNSHNKCLEMTEDCGQCTLRVQKLCSISTPTFNQPQRVCVMYSKLEDIAEWKTRTLAEHYQILKGWFSYSHVFLQIDCANCKGLNRSCKECSTQTTMMAKSLVFHL